MLDMKMLLAVACLSLGGTAGASPLYYSFTGTVSGVYTDGPSGYYSETSTHYALGQEVNFVFSADQALGAYNTYNGAVYPITDDGWGHYFYSSYVSGSAIAADAPNPFYGSSYYGYNAASQAGLTGSNADLSGYDQVRVDSYGFNMSQWTAGKTGFAGQDVMFIGSPEGIYREFNYFSLTLTSVSETAPSMESVPEPASLALLGLGLVGLILGVSRRPRT